MQGFGMFGPDPYQARMMDEAQALQEIKAIDEGGPSVGVGILANRGFRQLGEAFGGQDPAMARGNKMKEIVEKLRQAGIDINDPEAFYPAMIKELSAAGMNNEAMAMADKYQKDSLEVAVKGSQAEKYRAEAEKARADKQPELVRLQNALKSAVARNDEKAAQEIMKQIRKLTAPDVVTITEGVGSGKRQRVIGRGGEEVYTGSEYADEKTQNPFGTTPDGTPVFADERGKGAYIVQAGKKVPYDGPVKPTGGITVDNRGETADNDAAAFDYKEGRKSHNTRYAAAVEMAPYINRYKMLVNNKNLLTGTAADFRTALERFAVTMGVKDPKSLEDSELFDSTVMRLVLPQMAKLGGSDSNEELKKIMESTGDRKMTIGTLRRIVELMEKETGRVMQGETEYEKFIAGGGNRLGWNWNTYSPYARQPAVKPSQGTKPTETKPGTAPSPKSPGGIPMRAINAYIEYQKSLGKNITPEEAEQALLKFKGK